MHLSWALWPVHCNKTMFTCKKVKTVQAYNSKRHICSHVKNIEFLTCKKCVYIIKHVRVFTCQNMSFWVVCLYSFNLFSSKQTNMFQLHVGTYLSKWVSLFLHTCRKSVFTCKRSIFLRGSHGPWSTHNSKGFTWAVRSGMLIKQHNSLLYHVVVKNTILYYIMMY